MIPPPIDCPSDRIPIRDVPAYVLANHGFSVTRQTYYNWISRGVQGEKLKVFLAPGTPNAFPPMRFTTPTFVDDFIARVGPNIPF